MGSKAAYRPADYLNAAQAFSIEIRKTDDGKFEAFSPSRPEIAPVTASDRRDAIQGLTSKLNDFVQGGFNDSGDA